MKRTIIYLALCILPINAHAWGNGQSGNASTNEPLECDNPPYSTHDWIADHALKSSSRH